MYQIFVVEDELLIRQSIRNLVENMPGPYSFCGEASDGEMALSMMQDLMPDILLTDIRMPFLDGFGLMEHVRSMMPWIKIAIISGYGDFAYAQKAISLGASQYLLKPLRPGDLTRAIEEMAAQIEREKAADKLPVGYDQDELNQVLHQHFMHQLLGGNTDMGVLLERARNLGLQVVHPAYQVVVFSFEREAGVVAQWQERLIKMLSVNQWPLYDINELDQLTLLVYGADSARVTEEAYRVVQIIRHEMKDTCSTITTVVGDVVTRLSAVSDAYRKAKETLKNASSFAPGQVIDGEDTAALTDYLLMENGPFDPAFQQKLLSCSPEGVDALVEAYLQGEGASKFSSVLIRYYALVDVVKLAVQLRLRTEPDLTSQLVLGEMGKQHDLYAAASTRKDFASALKTIFKELVVKRRLASAGTKVPPLIAKADAFVAENYCDPNISLLLVARHVGLSPAHFSTLFSQAHGVPFISYLTNMRMERAKELLANTDQKLAAIALDIGYNEPNYFSHVFRKTVGMTPKEYRQQAGNEG